MSSLMGHSEGTKEAPGMVSKRSQFFRILIDSERGYLLWEQ